MKHAVVLLLVAAGAAQAGMIGDPVTASILINGNKVGSFDGVNSNVVGPGIEFALVDNFLGFSRSSDFRHWRLHVHAERSDQ